NLLGLGGLVADFQTSRVVVGEVLEAGDELTGLVGSFVTFRIVLGALMYAVCIAFVVIGGYPQLVVEGVILGGLSFFVSTATWALYTVCQARLWLHAIALSMVAAQIVQFAVTAVLFARNSQSMLHYVAAFVLFDVVTLIWMTAALWRTVRVSPRVEPRVWLHWLKDAAPLAIGSTLGTLYFRIDGVMLSKLGSLKDVGVYQIGYKFSDLLAFMAPAMLGAVLPLMIRSWPDRIPEFRQTFRQAFIIFIAFGVFAAVTFAVLCGPAIATLYPARYVSAARPARLLVLGQAINLFTQLAFVTLVASHRRKLYPIATFVGVIVNVVLNIVLIPRYSVTGAGISTVVTEVVVLSILGYAIRDLPIRPLPWRPIGVVAVSGAALGAALLALRSVAPWEVALVASLVVYPALLHVLRIDGPGGLLAFARQSRFRAE
ncbi:MAG TPA: polysaccharide biosynthesis C-terminal domain-containing protein, partial [Acidimicrobiia bacterium]